jgi:hypothetical protein
MASRPSVLAVAVLLVLVSPAAATSFADPADAATGSSSTASLQADDRNVTRGLSLQGETASNLTTASSDTSSLLDVQASDLQAHFETYRLEERMRSLDSRDAQREALRQEIPTIVNRLDRLKAEERNARLAYLDGRMNASEFVVALARVSAKAEHTGAKMSYIQTQFGSTFPNVVRAELRPFRPEVEALQGPVRTHATDVLRGDTSSNRLYVAASENGTRLSMLQDRTWQSQTTRWDNFDRTVDPVGDIEAAVTTGLAAVHPELNFSRRTPGYSPFGENPDLFRVPLSFEYGEIEGYFDGSSGALFHEEQALFLDSLPPSSSEREIEDDLILTVNRTYAGGPLKVRLTNRSGRLLDGDVRINGELVGSTGFDGTLWTLDRPGAYNVTVVRDGQRIDIKAATATFES